MNSQVFFMHFAKNISYLSSFFLNTFFKKKKKKKKNHYARVAVCQNLTKKVICLALPEKKQTIQFLKVDSVKYLSI